jgi:hypothetical protein
MPTLTVTHFNIPPLASATQRLDAGCAARGRHKAGPRTCWLHGRDGQVQRGLQVAGVGHRGDDVGATQQLAARIQLREGRPVRELLRGSTIKQGVCSNVELQQSCGGGGGRMMPKYRNKSSR